MRQHFVPTVIICCGALLPASLLKYVCSMKLLSLQGRLIALFTSDAQVIAQATAILPLIAFVMVSSLHHLLCVRTLTADFVIKVLLFQVALAEVRFIVHVLTLMHGNFIICCCYFCAIDFVEFYDLNVPDVLGIRTKTIL